MAFSESLDIYFFDFGVDCIKPDLNTIKVILDIPEKDVFSEMVIAGDYKCTAKTSDVSSLNINDILTIDGTTYYIKRIIKIDDGKISEIYLGSTT